MTIIPVLTQNNPITPKSFLESHTILFTLYHHLSYSMAPSKTPSIFDEPMGGMKAGGKKCKLPLTQFYTRNYAEIVAC